MRALNMGSFRTKVQNHIRFLAMWWRSIGTLAIVRWELLMFLRKLGAQGPATWRVRPRQVQHGLSMRLSGSSDMIVFDQIFVSEEYSCLRTLDEIHFVVDLGANVGFSSAYFLSCYPNSRVLAVEPDDRNIAVCRANLAPYGERALVLHGAVWSKPTRLRLAKGVYGDGSEWATQVHETTGGETQPGDIQGWDMQSLIRMAGAAHIDLLKVDIERAEMTVFGASADGWLSKVRNICIELHGSDCEKVFFDSLKEFEYDLGHSGELTICRNLRPRGQA